MYKFLYLVLLRLFYIQKNTHIRVDVGKSSLKDNYIPTTVQIRLSEDRQPKPGLSEKSVEFGSSGAGRKIHTHSHPYLSAANGAMGLRKEAVIT